MKKALLIILLLYGLIGVALSPLRIPGILQPRGDIPAPDPDILWYKFNENTGTTLGDSASTNSGTIDNAAMWTTGKAGSAIVGSGTDAAATDAPIVYGVDIMTVTFWVNDSAFGSPAFEALVHSSTDINAADHRWAILCPSSSQQSGYIQATGTRQESYDATDSTWVHIAVVLDNSSTAGDIKIYLDGVLQGETLDANTKTLSSNFASEILYILSRGDSDLHSDATIDDLRIYGRELTLKEIERVRDDPQ